MQKGRNIVYASSRLIKSIYGQDVLSRLDEEEDEDDIWLDNTGCLVEIKAVELIELDEVILGALNKESYTFAQKGKKRKLKIKVGNHVKKLNPTRS